MCRVCHCSPRESCGSTTINNGQRGGAEIVALLLRPIDFDKKTCALRCCAKSITTHSRFSNVGPGPLPVYPKILERWLWPIERSPMDNFNVRRRNHFCPPRDSLIIYHCPSRFSPHFVTIPPVST